MMCMLEVIKDDPAEVSPPSLFATLCGRRRSSCECQCVQQVRGSSCDCWCIQQQSAALPATSVL